MSKPRKKYTKEEKLELVKLSLEEDQSVKELSIRFGVSQNCIYNWRSAYLKDDEKAFPGKGKKVLSDSERRLVELERENRELKLERDILKKAVGIFSKNDRKFSNL